MRDLTLYDAHNHLHDVRFAGHWPEILRALDAIHLRKAIVNGTREEDWDSVLKLAASDARFVPSLGLHPWHARERTPHWLEKLESMLDQQRCGIGEIGLDRWIEPHDLPDQEAAFLPQWRAAVRRNLPVTIHCLKAWGRLLEMLEAEARPACGFLLHSYGGPAEMIGNFAKLGAYFSISGHFAHERKARQREAFKLIPLDRLLIETDAPDMLPPERIARPLLDSQGQAINHPENLAEIYAFTAELRGLELRELAARVEENFHALFGGIFR